MPVRREIPLAGCDVEVRVGNAVQQAAPRVCLPERWHYCRSLKIHRRFDDCKLRTLFRLPDRLFSRLGRAVRARVEDARRQLRHHFDLRRKKSSAERRAPTRRLPRVYEEVKTWQAADTVFNGRRIWQAWSRSSSTFPRDSVRTRLRR